MPTETPTPIRTFQDLRLSLAMSQGQFAEWVGVRRHTIWCLENGKNPPALRTIRAIHDKTGIPVAFLQNPAFWRKS